MLRTVEEAPVRPAPEVPDKAEKRSQFCGAVKSAGIVQFKSPSPPLKIRSVCGGDAAPPSRIRKTNDDWLNNNRLRAGITATATGTRTDAPLAVSRTTITA